MSNPLGKSVIQIAILAQITVSCAADEKKKDVPAPAADSKKEEASETKATEAKPQETSSSTAKEAALALLKKKCESCHSDSNQEGGIGSLLDESALTGDQGLVVPGKPAESKLYSSLKPTGSMPKDGDLTADEAKLIHDWIMQIKPTGSESSGPTLAELQKQALAISRFKCEPCHNPVRADGGFESAMDVQAMIESKVFLVPGKPDESLFYTRLKPRSNMPVDMEISDSEVRTIKEWIEALSGRKKANRVPLSDGAYVNMLSEALAGVEESQRKGVRFFSLRELYNAGVPDFQLENYRKAFAKTINSLSNAKKVYKPTPLDEEKLIFAVDLENSLDMRAETFDNFVLYYYPFGRKFTPGAGDDAEKLRRQVSEMTSTANAEQFSVRMDWFIATALLPGPYNQLLRLPDTVEELEESLGIDVAASINARKVKRTGLKDSGVSSNNRMLERHEFGDGRAYWLSYDFGQEKGAGNILDNPLSPHDLPDEPGVDDYRMNPDGGETIFDLPNGFIAFYLQLSTGESIDKGPVAIVKNPYGPRQFNGAIVNAISCFSCHTRGIIDKNDRVADYVRNSTSFSATIKGFVSKVYVSSREFTDQVNSDNNRYHAALREAGLDPDAPDPITPALLGYQARLTRGRVIAELGISESAFDQLMKVLLFRREWAGLEVTNGSIKRETFNAYYGRAISMQSESNGFKPVPILGDFFLEPKCMVGSDTSVRPCLKPVQ